MEYLTIFLAGFCSVFMLGFQSRNVNNGNYGWAAATSFLVGISSAFLWSHIMVSNQKLLGGLVYGTAGALAITSSMYIHRKFIQRDK